MEQYGHGGDIWTAAEIYGRDKNDFLDYSSNMNPFGPPECVQRILQEEWKQELVRYPDPVCRELRAAISAKYNIPMDSILVGNGAAEVIDLAVRALKPSTVGLLRPCFSEYEEAAIRAGAMLMEEKLEPEADYTAHDSCLFEAADLLFLGHPNNPTGQPLAPDWIRTLLERGKRVILDEAFMDFNRDERELSYIRYASEAENLLVVRSMTKFYAIPGIRLGYIVAHPRLIQRMSELQVQWSVNGLAQRIGTEVLRDSVYEAQTVAWLYEERPWLIQQLQELGLRVYSSVTNYLLFALNDTEGFNIKELQSRMAQQGILIRDASTFKGLNARYGRTAIKLRQDNLQLIEGLRITLEALRNNR